MMKVNSFKNKIYIVLILKIHQNLLYLVYEFDNTYRLKYNNCINEINQYYKKHSMILITYNNVINIDRKKFKNFDINFNKFVKKLIR